MSYMATVSYFSGVDRMAVRLADLSWACSCLCGHLVSWLKLASLGWLHLQ